ncbi:type IA DNA topoisomerase, partial [Mycoplasma nasistruthionis]|uniref:type IA DNA topoisomerase n=1 Tax=Mycoplasma nasistruthionis TaxID=353852 RepID=UPI0021CAEDD9
MNKLIIVESPNKVETIKKYVGNEYIVLASVGHILKMKTTGTGGLGIDFENWEPQNSLESSKKEVVKKLKEALAISDFVYIATDPDREGEAIGQNLVDYLKIKNFARIKYNEITKEAILKALANPGKIDQNLVDAQKTRRMLDRIIGFKLSGLMRYKFKNAPGNPSAGRVQSIALKLIIDRENEIRNFIPEKYAKLHAVLADTKQLAYYHNDKNESDRKDWIYQNELDTVKKHFDSVKKELLVIDKKTQQRKAPAITPLKQAVVYRRSTLSSQSAQYALQKLYEGYGDGGLITYPRTDSTRLSESFVNQGQAYIAKKWGSDYIATEVKGFSGDQDAHEAIRPTDIALTPDLAKNMYPNMSNSEYAIYKLVYETSLQALMKQPIRQVVSYTYSNGDYVFKNSFSKVIFDGYYVVVGKSEEVSDPNYEVNQIVSVSEFNFEDHETKPLPRYNDGSLIEALDNIKVGRPS